MSHKFVVSKNHHSRRLDKVLRSLWPEVPLGALMKDIRKGRVRIDGKKGNCSMRLSEGQEVYVPWEDPVRNEVTAVRRPLKTVYRDDDVWIINKPSNLLSQPSRKGEDSVLTRSWADDAFISEDFKPALVNRLDRNTSGVMIIALNGSSLRSMQEALRGGCIRKFYIAVVCGEIPQKGKLEFPLLKDGVHNTVKVSNAGSPSVTLFRRLYKGERFSLVRLELVTGRSHQARVHMSYFGHPILGDIKYGDRKENDYWWNKGVKRPLLHASELIFSGMDDFGLLPGQNSFIAPLPEDMKSFFSKNGWEGSFLE